MQYKIPEPNYTQIPNVIIDNIMMDCGDAELKVVLTIARKTFGWHKERDMISLTQLEKSTGLSRQGVINGINAGVSRGIILKKPQGISFTYELVVNEVDYPEDPSSQRSRLPLVNEVDYPVDKVVNEVDTQKKPSNLKKLKETSVEIPESLNVPDFLPFWEKWVCYRKESRHALTASTIKFQFKKLECYDPATAAAMLTQSIENGWQGIFPLRDASTNFAKQGKAQAGTTFSPIPR